MDWYPWLVFAHVAAAFGFVMSHGVSAYAAFAIRRERDRDRIAALLDLSQISVGGLYVSLLTLLVAGIAAGIAGGWFGRGWIWTALAVLIAIIVAMYAMASRYYGEVRAAVGLPSYRDKKGEPAAAPATPDELAGLLDTRRPEALAIVGVGGLAIIVWLMVVKPF